MGITLSALVLVGASAFSFAAIRPSAFVLPRGVSAIGSSAALAIPAIVSLSTLVHGILLAMPRRTTRERRIRSEPIRNRDLTRLR